MIEEPASRLLHAAMVAVYRPYVERRVARLSAAVDDEAIEAGDAWLDSQLQALLMTPFARQQRSPLEVFQEAMRFPNEALAAAGVTRPRRDSVAESALPLDWYDLSPASSQELGSGVWEAHLAWGAAKAAALSGPVATNPEPETAVVVSDRPAVGLLSTDIMDRSKIQPIVEGAGFAMVVWRRRADVDAGTVVMGLIDLGHAAADDVVRDLAAADTRTIAFGPHVDDFAMARAASLGASTVLPRSQFFRRLEGLLPAIT